MTSTVQPKSNFTEPPQFSDPAHQMYEGMLPKKMMPDTSSVLDQPPYLIPKSLKKRNTPFKYKGIQVYPSEDIKADIMVVNKNEFKSQSIGTLIPLEIASSTIVFSKSMEELKAKYPTAESLQGKRVIIVGDMPMVTLGDKTMVVLPKSLVKNMGSEKDKIFFPVAHNETIPLLEDHKEITEQAIAEAGGMTSGLVIAAIVIMIMAAFFIFFKKK